LTPVRAGYEPVRVNTTGQNNNLELRFCFDPNFACRDHVGVINHAMRRVRE
jgi:hypothetical protein